VPTSLPPNHEPESRNLHGLGADAWAGVIVILGMFVVGVIYWSGHTNDAHATTAPASQTTASSTASHTTSVR
jgi:hypothetical protein